MMVVFGDTADARSLFLHGPVDGVFLMLHSATEDELKHSTCPGGRQGGSRAQLRLLPTLQSSMVPSISCTLVSTYPASTRRASTGKCQLDAATARPRADTRASFDLKRDAWEYIKTLPIASTYVGPAGFMETLLWPGFASYTAAWDPSYVHKYVCTDDIGHVAADCLADPDRFAGREIMLAGDALTGAQVAEVVKEVTGKDVGGTGEIDHAYAKHLFEVGEEKGRGREC